MPSTSSDAPPTLQRLQRRHSVVRWWLAGLIVGCLLPGSLAPTEGLRAGERSASVYFWVPAIIRAQFQYIARKRRALRFIPNSKVLSTKILSFHASFFPQVLSRLVAALDVIAPRGPPRFKRLT